MPMQQPFQNTVQQAALKLVHPALHIKKGTCFLPISTILLRLTPGERDMCIFLYLFLCFICDLIPVCQLGRLYFITMDKVPTTLKINTNQSLFGQEVINTKYIVQFKRWWSMSYSSKKSNVWSELSLEIRSSVEI